MNKLEEKNKFLSPHCPAVSSELLKYFADDLKSLSVCSAINGVKYETTLEIDMDKN